MKISLPITVQNKGLTDNQLVFIAFIHRLKLTYPAEWYSIYKYDIGVILQTNRTSPFPLNMFEDLTKYVRVRYASDYKFDIYLKNWTEESFEYEIKDFRNVIVWSLLIDHNSYLETDRNIPSDIMKLNASATKRNLVAALNIHYQDYGRIRLRE